MNADFKTHLLGMRSVLHYYFLGVAVSWAGFPIICMVSVRLYWTVDKIQTFYSVFAVVAYAILTYLGMHDFGEHDRRPYKWSRYKAKGLVCGAMGFAVIYLAEVILIFAANKFIRVQHPIINIEGLHGYVTQILYMPFFWVYKMIDPEIIIPSVGYLSALLPGIYVIAVNGFAYWMGYTDKVLIKHKPKGLWAQRLFYGRTNKKKKKQSWTERLLTKPEQKGK